MENYSKIEQLYNKIYNNQPEAFAQLKQLMEQAMISRSKALRTLDKKDANWYFSHKMIGMTLYVDLFAETFVKLSKKIDYLKELGITYVHLMPLLKPRDGENDGGYAVADYRQTNQDLGTLEEFKSLLLKFAKNDIKVCIDYVVNHVAKEHEWAQAALQHDKQKQDYFIMFDTDEIPNLYNQTVPEVLPEKAPGNFTYYPQIDKYVFTSFSEFQWDLNFKNPYVFNGMIDNMLYLANLGVNMLRLDAIPFMWKEVGTTCRNLEPIHDLMQLFYLIKDEVCPSLALLGEAIVEPHEIVKYFGTDKQPECEVMYNANLMVDIYHSFATRDVRLLTIDANRFQIPKKGTWMNYVRCHDDIGWGFNEAAITEMGFDPFAHKQFLIQFYGDDFEGSFAKGEHYQYNPITKDARTNGTLASLLGLEKAMESKQEYRKLEAIRRINLAHALILSYRGIPLIYSSDEIATINDQSYLQDPNKANEGRWVHRPIFDWKKAKNRDVCYTPEYEVFQFLKKIIEIRKKTPLLHGQASQYALDTENNHVLCLIRQANQKTMFSLFNFSESSQKISTQHLRQLLLGNEYVDLIYGREFNMHQEMIELSPFEVVWAIAK